MRAWIGVILLAYQAATNPALAQAVVQEDLPENFLQSLKKIGHSDIWQPLDAVPPEFSQVQAKSQVLGENKLVNRRDPGQDSGLFEIERSGNLMLRVRVPSLLDFPLDESHLDDFNGDHVIDLACPVYTMGLHCCVCIVILTLGDNAVPLTVIPAQDSDVYEILVDKDDHLPRFHLADSVFAYFGTSFAESPLNKIVVKVHANRPVLDVKAMRIPPPTEDTLHKLRETLTRLWREPVTEPKFGSLKPNGDDFAPVVYPNLVLREFTRLTYEGNGDIGQKLVEETWPKDKTGREFFIRSVKEKLETSHWWGGIKELNGW